MSLGRRGFLGALAAATAAVVTPLKLTQPQVEAATVAPAQGLAELSTVAPGTRHFAVLMGYDGQAIRTMMIDNLPVEIHFQWRDRDVVSIFRLVSKDRYDGRPVEGLARYIMHKGPAPAWPEVKLGF